MVGFYGISTLEDYLMPNPVCIYIYIYTNRISTLEDYLMPKSCLYIYIYNIYDL